VPSVEERTYQQRFPQVMTREIYTEFTLAHPKQERRLKITIQGFYRHKGKVVHKPEVETNIPANTQESVYWFYKHQGEGGASPALAATPVVIGQSAHTRSMSILTERRRPAAPLKFTSESREYSHLTLLPKSGFFGRKNREKPTVTTGLLP
jgi:hypothetical protein